MARERALDIFPLLERIDRKDYGIWSSLNEAQRKEFSALIVMRWMAGTTDPMQLIFLNELVNVLVFSLPNHDELMLKLLTVCSNGQRKRYNWVQYKVVGSKKVKRSIELIASHYGLSIEEAEDSRRLFSDEEIMTLAEMAGLQKDEITELKKELK